MAKHQAKPSFSKAPTKRSWLQVGWQPQAPSFRLRAVLLATAALGAALFAYLSIKPRKTPILTKPAPTSSAQVEWPEGFVELNAFGDLSATATTGAPRASGSVPPREPPPAGSSER
ncbi:MAG: hypothetical protein U0271_10785 [Polyangiaceae bacterium]